MDFRDLILWFVLCDLFGIVIWILCCMARRSDEIEMEYWEDEMSKRYIIVGDTETSKGCLVMTCGASKERAEEVLNKLLSDPEEQDKRMIEGHTNLRVEEVDSSDCWWED